MSRTLFWYIMRDLLKVFLMASGVFAGILSFVLLLKPLMQFGLSGKQIGQMLMYLQPATQTSALPFAALFATTMVYGRLSADNELTACRAAGISYLWLMLPAFILGLVLVLVTLASVSFIVPDYFLKAEKVVFANLAEVVQKNIQRTHQLRLQGNVIFAEDAQVLPANKEAPDDDIVELYSPMFCLQEVDEKTKLLTPTEFYTARTAQVRIHRVGEQVQFWAQLKGGVRIPRRIEGAAIGGIETAEFGPVLLPSPVRENPKFMNIAQLKDLHLHPTKSREIRALFSQLIGQSQEQYYIGREIAPALRKSAQWVAWKQEKTPSGLQSESYTLTLTGGLGKRVTSPDWYPTLRGRSRLALKSTEGREIRLAHTYNGDTTVDEAAEGVVTIQSDLEQRRLWIEFELIDVRLGPEDNRISRPAIKRPLNIPAPASIQKLPTYTPEAFLKDSTNKSEDMNRLQRKLDNLQCAIEVEIHGRASFSVSSLILVLVGCSLGMMFRTANYLSAFGLAVIPALICFALIGTGQHLAENNPRNLTQGIIIIWSGNGLVLLLAMLLMRNLQRQ